ncbi:FxLD family lantipeptide [Streptomyces sp. NBC_00557]|uniref:FxLD family lantipeptide n=1 Tax=Streptomyces sp. NBC_00557 TaxID=2975776 RepID=UPI002E7FDE2C|nr:FxLD family lantipeptide [Streptomyces sp. NBC_00557]WUC39639.1 FxLD family lantipeptide [Streptomyces sp. NBC_00557]
MAQASTPLASQPIEAPLSSDEWELETTITTSPTPIVDMCDTSDGCAKSCASSCASS